MDDLSMADDSSSGGSAQHRFNSIVDMLGESSRSTMNIINNANTTSAATTTTTQDEAFATNSVMFEKDESIILANLQKLYPYFDLKKDSLPRYWNETAPSLSRTPDFLRLHYTGKGGKDPKEAAAARANRPVHNMTIVYYFEIFVANKGVEGFMGLGLSTKNVDIKRLPGWDPISYGYHGDDGHFFECAGKGVPYGPTYTTGDTVGCGLNFVTRELFFTKNGEFLGVATNNVKIEENLYPTAGMQTNGEMIDVNFGQKPFKFDIMAYKKKGQETVAKSIQNIELPPEKAIWMNRTVLAWLEHEGYSRVLEALHKATNSSMSSTIDEKNTCDKNAAVDDTNHSTAVKKLKEISKEEMENRRFIIRLVQEGKTSDAIKEIERVFPSLLYSNKELYMLLKIQQFVEMIADIAKENYQLKSDKIFENGTSVNSNQLSNFSDKSNLSTNWSDSSSLSTNRLRTNAAAPLPSGSRLKRNNQPFYLENGRNTLKRRSSEDKNSSVRQSPRRANYGGNSLSNSSRSNWLPSLENNHTNCNENSNEPNLLVMEDSMEIVNKNDNNKLDLQNGNTETSLSTNGYKNSFSTFINLSDSNATVTGTPPTSTTIIEELNDLNENTDGWEGTIENNNIGHKELESDSLHCSANDYQHLRKFLPVIEFGHSVSQFAEQLGLSVMSTSLYNRMNDAFSLIGYNDPTQSNNSYLLDQRQRNIVAKALNKSILELLGKESVSRLDFYIRKAYSDRHRSMAFTTAAIYSDVNKLVFNSLRNSFSFNTKENTSKSTDVCIINTDAENVQTNNCLTVSMGEDDNSNSSNGSSSIGIGTAFVDSYLHKPASSTSAL